MKNVMIDLETFGTTPTAPIVSIGAVKFDADGLGDRFYRLIDVESTLRDGAVIETGTVMWWLEQSDDARGALKGDAADIGTAMIDFAQWARGCLIWGNGASFDNVILTAAYQRAYGKPMWPFWNDRCYRTIKSCFKDAPMPERAGTHHNALDDAVFQAQHLMAINKHYPLGIL